MTYATHAHFKDYREVAVAPVGEGIYVAVEETARFVARVYRAVRTKVREHATVTALEGLDDWALRDIGVERSGIHHVACQVAGTRHYRHGTVC